VVVVVTRIRCACINTGVVSCTCRDLILSGYPSTYNVVFVVVVVVEFVVGTVVVVVVVVVVVSVSASLCGAANLFRKVKIVVISVVVQPSDVFTTKSMTGKSSFSVAVSLSCDGDDEEEDVVGDDKSVKIPYVDVN
jgi:hypothetical protein